MKKSKEEILKELNKAFDKFKFFPDDHHYELNGVRVGTSVTRLIEDYGNEFDTELIAQKVAVRDGKTLNQVLEEWKYKNEFACTKGSTCHEFAQSLWSGEPWLLNDFDFSTEYEMAVYKIKRQAEQFYEDYKDKLIHIADEYVVGSEEYDIASAIDHLFMVSNDTTIKATIIKKLKPEHILVNIFCGDVIIVDYKTNTTIKGYNDEAYQKPMKPPLQHLNDDKFTHYKLQLSIYKYLIEKYTNIKIKEIIIVYFTEKNDHYEIIQVPYLKDEVEEILEWRLWE